MIVGTSANQTPEPFVSPSNIPDTNSESPPPDAAPIQSKDVLNPPKVDLMKEIQGSLDAHGLSLQMPDKDCIQPSVMVPV